MIDATGNIYPVQMAGLIGERIVLNNSAPRAMAKRRCNIWTAISG